MSSTRKINIEQRDKGSVVADQAVRSGHDDGSRELNIKQRDGGSIVVDQSVQEAKPVVEVSRLNLGDPVPGGGSALRELVTLIGAFFAEPWELRAFVRFTPRLQSVEPFLPGGAASIAEIASTLVKGLASRGLIDSVFFSLLKAERPARVAEIEAVERRFSSSNPQPQQEEFPPCDVLLVTATTVEARTLLESAFQKTTQIDKPRFLHNTYSYLGCIGGANVYMVRSEMGIGTPGGSLLTIRNAIAEIGPKSVIMVGIAFGVDPARQQIGDVIVSTKLHYYSPDRVGSAPDGSLRVIPRGSLVDATGWIIGRLRESADHWKGGAVKFGLLLSGESLVDNLQFRNQILARTEEALGGEMEGAGLYAAAWDTQVSWVVVKSICDWADGNKARDADARQRLAASAACSFVLDSIMRGGFRG